MNSGLIFLAVIVLLLAAIGIYLWVTVERGEQVRPYDEDQPTDEHHGEHY